MADLKETPTSRNILRIETPYSNAVYKLDIFDSIIIRNKNNVIIESLSIDKLVNRFYDNHSQRGSICFDCVFIWNLDKQEIVRHITNLPDTHIKERKKAYRIKIITEEIERLTQELEDLQTEMI